jgi:hypothetical protein
MCCVERESFLVRFDGQTNKQTVVSPTLVEAAAGCIMDINAVQRLEDPSPWPSERWKSELRMVEPSQRSRELCLYNKFINNKEQTTVIETLSQNC